jgi:hypothetical protein
MRPVLWNGKVRPTFPKYKIKLPSFEHIGNDMDHAFYFKKEYYFRSAQNNLQIVDAKTYRRKGACQADFRRFSGLGYEENNLWISARICFPGLWVAPCCEATQAPSLFAASLIRESDFFRT